MAESAGKVFVHHVADAPLEIGEEDTAGTQVLRLRWLATAAAVLGHDAILRGTTATDASTAANATPGPRSERCPPEALFPGQHPCGSALLELLLLLLLLLIHLLLHTLLHLTVCTWLPLDKGEWGRGVGGGRGGEREKEREVERERGKERRVEGYY